MSHLKKMFAMLLVGAVTLTSAVPVNALAAEGETEIAAWTVQEAAAQP